MAAPARASVLTRVLARVLVLNVAVACAKLGFGYATGALSIISDGFHSLTDGASNVMGIVAMRAARKPPDEDHPYGHRKYEPTVSDKGTGQGSVISPLLANLYLHYVLDLWAERWRRREAAGNMIIVRYADDLIVGFEHETDARRFLDEMRNRLQEFALSLHSEKTRLIEFGRFAAESRKRRGLGKPETFTFLGFTFICSKTRRGKFQIKRKSRRDRMRAKLQAIKQELRRSMHQPIPKQGRWLQQVVTGYFNYHAVPTNSSSLSAFLSHVTNLWRRTLKWRSQKDGMTWERIKRLAEHWLPKPRILHPWPERRFAVRHPRWEPCARIGLARICAGGAR